MPVSNRHILEQSSSLGALGRVLLTTLEQQVLGKKPPKRAPALPGPRLEATYSPRSAELIRDYVQNVGGDPKAYGKSLPPHMFSQWCFGLAGRALEAVPYRMTRVLNAGCNYEVRTPIPANEPLSVSARLESIDDDGRRALMQVRLITSTPSVKEGWSPTCFRWCRSAAAARKEATALPRKRRGRRARACPTTRTKWLSSR
jgi:hypothetical protein